MLNKRNEILGDLVKQGIIYWRRLPAGYVEAQFRCL